MFRVLWRRTTWLLASGFCLVGLLVPAAHAQRIPSMGEGAIEDFLRHVVAPAEFTGAKLSPSGRYVLFIEQGRTSNDADSVLLFDLDAEGGPQGQRVDVGRRQVQWVNWASEDRFLIAVSSMSPVTVNTEALRRRRWVINVPATRVITVERDTLQLNAVLFDDQRSNFRNINLSEITDMLPDDPDHVLMPAYDRRNNHLYRVNIVTGESTRVERGTANTVAWYTANGAAVLRVDASYRGRHFRFYARTGRNGAWRRINTVRARDLFGARPDFEWAGPSDVPGQIFVRARPDNANFFGIYRYDLDAGEFMEAVALRDDYDIEQGLIGDTTGQYFGYSYHADRLEFEFVDEAFAAHYEGISNFFEGDVVVHPTSVGGDRMLLFVSGPTEPGVYYLYDRANRAIEPLFAVNRNLVADDLRPMRPVRYTARDGVEINGYFTEPRVGATSTTPLIVYPHGGPELRDTLTFDPVVQYLAAHGYAVFQPNYRGSAGYGRTFAESGYREWGRTMQDDITDGVNWLASQGLADPDQVCIVGFSYGGYAALAGAALTPDVYQCAVAGAPVTDFEEFIDYKSDISDEVRDYWIDLLGHPRRERDFVRETSPVHIADQVSIPLYLFHGDADERVPVDQSRSMAEALEAAGADFVYEEVPDIEHNWGEGRDFIITMRNIADFLEDAMPDGRIDTFDPNAEEEKPDEVAGSAAETLETGAAAGGGDMSAEASEDEDS